MDGDANKGETSRKKKTKVFSKDVLQGMSREELEEAVLQVSAHNTQLQALLRRSLTDTAGKSLSGGSKKQTKERPFDFSKHSSRHVLLLFAYLGWDYQGYAVQEDTLQTIEAVVFDALLKTKLIQDRQSSNYHRCGRTDKGVSAFSQVISITVRSKARPAACQADNDTTPDDEDKEIPYVDLLNRVLPPEVRMMAWSPVPPGFSARFDCTSRTYKYFFPRGSLDIVRMREAGKLLEGCHDFRNLCKMDVGNGVVNFQRSIDAVTVSLLEDECLDTLPNNEQVRESDFNMTADVHKNNIEFNRTDDENLSFATAMTDSDKETTSLNNIKYQLCNNSPQTQLLQSDQNLSRMNLNKLRTSVSSDSPRPDPRVLSENVQPRTSCSEPSPSAGFTMCVATITSKAFLWHQVRAMMAVLFLVGEGKEEPSIITELVDVEKNPRKPQYSLASEVPLCLFATEYPSEVVRWKYNKDVLTRVHMDLQHAWAHQAIRCGMIRRMLAALPGVPSQPPLLRQHTCLTPAAQPRVYRPLLQRHTCESLEAKVQHYVKRRRLDASVLTSIPPTPAAGAAASSGADDGSLAASADGSSATTIRQDRYSAASVEKL